MKQNLYFDTFEAQEAAFEHVWARFPVGNKPTWHHWWFYRYLQISPSFLLNQEEVDLLKQSNELIGDPFERFDKFLDLSRTGYTFGDVWNIDFIRWWYARARFQFEPEVIKKVDVQEIQQLELGKKIPKEDQERALWRTIDIFKEKNHSVFFPDFRIIGIPLQSSKRATLRAIEKYLDQTVVFGQAKAPSGMVKINKSKLREFTVRDSYKVLELRCFQQTPDLVELGVNAGVLRGAMADLKFHKNDVTKIESIQSLRSGTSRQLLNAIHLAENAARGKFPCIEMVGHEKPNYKMLQKTFLKLKSVPCLNRINKKQLLKDIEYFVEEKPRDDFISPPPF
jgi:hypothetical protein